MSNTSSYTSPYTLCAEFDWKRPIYGEKQDWENCGDMNSQPIFIDIQTNYSIEYLRELMFAHGKMDVYNFLKGFEGYLIDEEPFEPSNIYTIKNLKIYNEDDQRDRHIYSIMLDVVWEENKLVPLNPENGEVGYVE